MSEKVDIKYQIKPIDLIIMMFIPKSTIFVQIPRLKTKSAHERVFVISRNPYVLGMPQPGKFKQASVCKLYGSKRILISKMQGNQNQIKHIYRWLEILISVKFGIYIQLLHNLRS